MRFARSCAPLQKSERGYRAASASEPYSRKIRRRLVVPESGTSREARHGRVGVLFAQHGRQPLRRHTFIKGRDIAQGASERALLDILCKCPPNALDLACLINRYRHSGPPDIQRFTRRRTNRGSFRSLVDLQAAAKCFTAERNTARKSRKLIAQLLFPTWVYNLACGTRHIKKASNPLPS